MTIIALRLAKDYFVTIAVTNNDCYIPDDKNYYFQQMPISSVESKTDDYNGFVYSKTR